MEQAWQEHPDAAGALIVSPTPYGTCADISAIAALCHQRGKPLIVDEAWGAQLPFHPDLPAWAMDARADVCVVSVHKMGTGFEQGSVFHRQGNLVDPDQLSACARHADDDQPQRDDLRGAGRLAAADGPARLRSAWTPRSPWPRTSGTTSTPLPGLHVLREEFCPAEVDLSIIRWRRAARRQQ